MQTAFLELIAHFRAKAAQYSAMADTIEKEARELGYGEAKAPIGARATVQAVATVRHTVGLPTGEATVENIKAYLAIKKARIRDLAIHFNVREEAIRKLVDDRLNGIVIGDRGWLRCDEQSALTFNPEEELVR